MFTTIPYANAILVKMSRSGDFLMLNTTDRAHGRSQRFLIRPDKVLEWLDAESGSTLIEHDLYNFLALYRYDREKVTMRFTWLSHQNSKGDLSGYEQTVILPVAKLRKALIGFRVKALFEPDLIPQCPVRFTASAQKLIQTISRDKREKRALCKALSRVFHWRDASEVRITADWHRDFYFIADDMNGGLCRHESTVRGYNGVVYPRIRYEVHT